MFLRLTQYSRMAKDVRTGIKRTENEIKRLEEKIELSRCKREDKPFKRLQALEMRLNEYKSVYNELIYEWNQAWNDRLEVMRAK